MRLAAEFRASKLHAIPTNKLSRFPSYGESSVGNSYLKVRH